ncbi:MotA/TolQ/ExbB proton channel family protein [Campylobacter mucosalis]|uniref:TonB system transport protein ExbB n=1 Tax=Campylobacter mucosalis CCUG 21559 TaxID=1032067 RepID=A0A6G5QIQ6_9BACT|nr:MotA/TolQ/ExbB proton channel family protein [Campylobacter mucosalis]QCD45568.1 TonB system transport protein ExbB [Campylobacter mucosalis CCUG 21559]
MIRIWIIFFTAILAFGDEVKIDMSFNALFNNAHIVVKGVIVLLVLFSIASWTIFFVKITQFKKAFGVLKHDTQSLKELKDINDNLGLSDESFLSKILTDVKDELVSCANTNERLRNAVDIRVMQISNDLREKITILASIGSSAPFIGLFGTVWGIMNSFIGIASANNASLAVVAPGIAEALFATALGLAAAIPAVLLYNYFVRLNAKFKDELCVLGLKVYLKALRSNNDANK